MPVCNFHMKAIQSFFRSETIWQWYEAIGRSFHCQLITHYPNFMEKCAAFSRWPFRNIRMKLTQSLGHPFSGIFILKNNTKVFLCWGNTYSVSTGATTSRCSGLIVSDNVCGGFWDVLAYETAISIQFLNSFFIHLFTSVIQLVNKHYSIHTVAVLWIMVACKNSCLTLGGFFSRGRQQSNFQKFWIPRTCTRSLGGGCFCRLIHFH